MLYVKVICHNDACKWKGIELSNNVCEYEVNQLTNEKVIKGKETLMYIVNDAGRPTAGRPEGFH